METMRTNDTTPRPQKPRVYIASVLFIVAVTAVTAYIVREHKRPGQMTLIESQAMDMTVMKPPVGTVPVAVETVSTLPFDATVSYSGSALPYSEQEALARVEGWITTLDVYPGDEVKKGQLLARLDSSELVQRSRSAEYESQAAKSNSEAAVSETQQMKDMVDVARAALESAKSEMHFRMQELERMEKLHKSGAISLSELQQERAMNSTAMAEVDHMQAELNAAQRAYSTMVKKQQAMNRMADAGVARSKSEKITEGYLEVRSLLDGVVTERLLSPGTLAQPGAAILKIVDISKIRIQANVSEKDAANIRIGNMVAITSARRPGKEILAKITSVFPASDPVTRTVRVEAIVDNKDRAFFPGDSVKMRIATVSSAGAISVPKRAISRWGNIDGVGVWVAVGGGKKGEVKYTCVMHPEVIMDHPGICPKCKMDLVKTEADGNLVAHFKTVTTGVSSGERIEILEGLSEGEKVVTNGWEDLAEGSKLFITDWSAEGPKKLPPAPGTGASMDELMKKGGDGHESHSTEDKHEAEGATQYTCPMHPEVISDKPGSCPKCKMDLVPVNKKDSRSGKER